MFLAKLSIKRPVMVTMLITVFVIFGIMAYREMPLTSLPDVDIPYVTVQTIFPGAGPNEVEQQISILIENAVSTISGIDYIESYSMDNFSLVLIAFDMSKDVDIANQEVKDKVDAISNDLPTDAEKPIIEKFDISATPVIGMVLSGTQSSTELYEYADTVLKDRFSQIEGVAEVSITGGREREIQVIVNERAVFANRMSLYQLSQSIAQNNITMPSGTFKVGNQDLAVRVIGELNSLGTLRDLEVPTVMGNRRLSELAEVIDTGTEVRERATYFDNITGERHPDVIRLDLIPSSDGNPVQIARAVNRQIQGILTTLPMGMELSIVDDTSIFVESSVNDTMGNIIMGILLTGLLLFLFLGDIRSTVIVALAMPISIISTFSLMNASGFSLNIMSLLGLATSVGVLVINSIIVLENIFRYKDLGYNKEDSAYKGTAEIATAVIAATLTNLVVFVPIGTMSGMVGQFFVEFGLTVAYTTVFSLLVAFTLTPMLAASILPEKTGSNKISNAVDNIMKKIAGFYVKILESLMKTKLRSSISVFLTVILFIFSLFIFTKLGFEFMPMLDEGDIDLRVELPLGYHLDETANAMFEIEQILSNYPEIKHIVTSLGSMSNTDIGMQLANTRIKLVDVDERNVSTQQVTDRIIKDLSHIPNARIRVNAASSASFGGSDPITLYVSGLDDGILNDIANELFEKTRLIPGVVNLDTSTRTGRPEIVIEPYRDQLSVTGVNVMDIAIGVRAAIEGLVATQYKEDGEEYDIRVTLDETAYNSPEKLRNLTIMTTQGRFQLSQLADVRFSESVNRIIRRDKAKTIMITGAPATGYALGDITNSIDSIISDINFPDGYSTSWGGDVDMMQESMTEMGRAFLLAILLLYMLLAAILESYKQPLLIMSNLPLALIGVFIVQYMTGLTMNIFSMMAIIMLIGIVVNNGILILDYANVLQREEGKSMKEALLIACPIKLKAILMTNIAIILAMLPMALGMGDAGKEFRQSMGVVSVGGLIVSTILSLYLIPALSYVTTKIKK
ncbi:MAG: efflux RND transporter permease subunit [Candidatus Cloacimonetes bacterium]|nr:efflux RND transporter permease subunit [Candidatus Cloacimonadota bacterium]